MFLSSCSGLDIKTSKEHREIDKELDLYVSSFISESSGKVSRSDIKGLSVGFHNYPAKSSVIGTCWLNLNEIDISKRYWDRSLNLSRKELMYHELGHCVLGRRHTNPTSSVGFWGAVERFLFRIGWWKNEGFLDDGCPVSVMHSSNIGSYCFSKHYSYYITELFSKVEENALFSKERTKCTHREIQSECKYKIINHTNTWEKMDENTLIRAKKTCKKRYGGCLSIFVKKTNLSYQAICGE